MKRTSDSWRSEVLGLALGLEEDLLELNHIRPANEKSGTLEVLVQGMVRAWQDMGFSQDEIQRAFEAGLRNDFDIDAAWLDQRQEKQAWAEASSGRMGMTLTQLQSWSALVAMLACLGLLAVAVLRLGNVPLIIGISLFVGATAVAFVAGKFLGMRKARRLAAIKRGAQSPLEA